MYLQQKKGEKGITFIFVSIIYIILITSTQANITR